MEVKGSWPEYLPFLESLINGINKYYDMTRES